MGPGPWPTTTRLKRQQGVGGGPRLFWFPHASFPASHPDWPGVAKLDRGPLRVCDALWASEDMSVPSRTSWLWAP